MPVLAKHAINPDTFEETTFEPLVGSGPYIGRRGRARAQRHAQAQSGLLGPRSADQSRLLEFRRGPLRLLSRRQLAFRGLQEGPLRRAHRDRSRPLGDRLRLPGGARRPRRQGDVPDRPAERHARASSSTPAARSSPTSACARRSRCCSISNGSTTTSSSTATSAPRAISRAPNCRRAAAPADARERALLAPFPARCAPTSWTAHGRRRSTRRLRPRPRHAASARSRCSTPPATRSTAPMLRRRATRQAVHLRDPGHHRATRSGWRSPSRATSSAPASPRACAWSMPCSTTARRITYDFDMIEIPLGPVAVARQRAGVLLGRRPPPTPTARATTWASRARRSTP